MTTQTEQHLLVAIRAGLAVGLQQDIFAAMVDLADVYIERGETQEGADVLACLLRWDGVAEDIHDHALESWEDLERYICPRVLVDAEDFGSKATFDDLVEYIFAGT